MSAPYSVATEIEIAQVSSYLARAEAAKQSFYNGQPLDNYLHQLLVMESEIVDYRFQNYSSDLTLLQSGWYLYGLCGRFINQALKILGAGMGGIIIDPTTNQFVNLIGVTTMFTVGDLATNPLMAAGATGFTVNQSSILSDTVAFGYTSGSPLPRTGSVPAGQQTYSVVYTATSITISLSYAASAGEQYSLTYLRAGAGTIFPNGGSGLPVQAGHEGEVLFTDGASAYWRYPSTKITSADFSGDGVTCVNAEWVHNNLIIIFDDLPKVLELGTDYILVTGGGFQVIMAGFDATTNDYNLTVFLTGINA